MATHTYKRDESLFIHCIHADFGQKWRCCFIIFYLPEVVQLKSIGGMTLNVFFLCHMLKITFTRENSLRVVYFWILFQAVDQWENTENAPKKRSSHLAALLIDIKCCKGLKSKQKLLLPLLR